MASGLKVGDVVTVSKLHPLSQIDPLMQKYIGGVGIVTLVLPAEMSLPKCYRIHFATPGLEPLGFFGKELCRA